MGQAKTLLTGRRRELGLSAAEIASRLRVHPQTVTRWEGRRRLPGPVHIHGLADVLELEVRVVAAFFDETRKPFEPTGLPGRRLRDLRRCRSVSANAIASACGVHVSTVYNWETGRVRVPSDAVRPLAGVLGISERQLTTFLSGIGDRSSPAPKVAPDHPLRRRRARARLTQDAVARQIGVSRKQVSNWECGQPPPLILVRRLARFYGVPVSVMAAECGAEPPGSLDPADWAGAPLGEALRALRAWVGISQRELAGLVGRKPVTVRSWEAGRSTPSVRTVHRLEQLFNVPPGSLLAAGSGSVQCA